MSAELRVVVALVFTSCSAASVHEGRSSECGTCHTQQRDEWSASRHALSGQSPAFTAYLPRVEASWGRNARAQCEACHQPGHAEEAFVGCASCHLAVGNRGDANGAMVVDVTAPVATRNAGVRAPHTVSQRRFFDAPNLCGTCHEVKGPGHLDEPTLTEFFESPAEAGQTCTSCHFDEGHRFVGLSPAWGASQVERERATRRSTALLARALKLEVRDSEVRLTNTGAAHGVPTGMTSVREIWVEVSYVLNGETVSARVLDLGAKLEGADGRDVAVFTDAQRIVSRSLKFNETRAWVAPVGATGLSAVIKARAIRGETVRALELDEAEVPTLEVR